MLGAIADGETVIKGFLQGEDTLATLRAFQQMGVEIEKNNDVVRINGVGINGLKKPEQVLDFAMPGPLA